MLSFLFNAVCTIFALPFTILSVFLPEGCLCSLTLVLTTLFVAYKILDHFLRQPMIEDIRGRYVLVTGSGRGFGNAIARRLDEMGCYVFATVRSPNTVAALEKVLSKNSHVIVMDVSKPDSVREAFEQVKSILPSENSLWGIVNNAGVSGTRSGPTDWLQIADYKEVADVNLYGLIDTTMVFLPLIKKSQGRVVNMSSLYGRFVFPIGVNYAVTKYGLEAYSDCLRRNLRVFKCSVHIIEPGIYKTDIMSEDNIGTIAKNAWEATPQSVKDEYGPNYLQQFLGYVMRTADMEFFNRVPMVVDATVHALFGKYPRARYLVGNDAKFIFMPIQYLPEWLGDWILEVVGRPPVPAAMK